MATSEKFDLLALAIAQRAKCHITSHQKTLVRKFLFGIETGKRYESKSVESDVTSDCVIPYHEPFVSLYYTISDGQTLEWVPKKKYKDVLAANLERQSGTKQWSLYTVKFDEKLLEVLKNQKVFFKPSYNIQKYVDLSDVAIAYEAALRCQDNSDKLIDCAAGWQKIKTSLRLSFKSAFVSSLKTSSSQEVRNVFNKLLIYEDTNYDGRRKVEQFIDQIAQLSSDEIFAFEGHESLASEFRRQLLEFEDGLTRNVRVDFRRGTRSKSKRTSDSYQVKTIYGWTRADDVKYVEKKDGYWRDVDEPWFEVCALNKIQRRIKITFDCGRIDSFIFTYKVSSDLLLNPGEKQCEKFENINSESCSIKAVNW